MIQLDHITKTFDTGAEKVHAVSDVTLHIRSGEIFGIIGFSGAGKSTLVRCINLLERPTSGTVTVDGKVLTDLPAKELREARKKIGMIFQHFNLLMQKNVLENVCFPLYIQGKSKKDARKRAKELLDIVGLGDRTGAFPAQLSGGQKQRTAIARALVTRPAIILADEPTGNLDSQTELEVMSLLKSCVSDFGQTLIMITHDETIAQMADEMIIIEDGKAVRR